MTTKYLYHTVVVEQQLKRPLKMQALLEDRHASKIMTEALRDYLVKHNSPFVDELEKKKGK
jgi:hypothetical protein